HTTIATVLGYPEYIASSPPKKYHKITWTGTAEQTAVWWPHAFPPSPPGNISDAKYVYDGFGEIDTHGNQISNYTKNYFTPCPESLLNPTINSPNPPIHTLRGYCYTPDPGSCPVCNNPPLFQIDAAANRIFDEPADLLGGN